MTIAPRKLAIGLLICFLFAALLLTMRDMQPKKPPVASHGVIDLSNRDITQGHIRLDGEWEFRADTPGFPQSLQYVKVPGSLTFGSGAEFSPAASHGTGTYHLEIRLPAHTGPVALYIQHIYSAAEIMVNGVQVYKAGTVGLAEKDTVPGFNPGIVPLPVQDSQIMTLDCRIANYSYYKGGIISSIYLGSEKEIARFWNRLSWHEAVLFGIFFIIAAYHLALYALRRKELASLFFGLACAFFSLRILSSDSMLLLQAHPDLPWSVLLRIQYISFYFAVGFFLLFFRTLFPAEFPEKPVLAVEGGLLALTAATVILPVAVFSFWIAKPFEIFAFASMLCSLLFLSLAVIRKRDGAAVILAGFIVLITTAVNDMLYTSQIINTGYILKIGFLVFIFSHAFVLAKRFTNSFYAVERLSEEIRESEEKLHDTIVHLSENEKHATINTLVAGIAHDVSSPLGLSITAFSFLEDRIKSLGENPSAAETAAYQRDFTESAGIIRSNLTRASYLMRSFKDIVADQYNEEPRVFGVKEYLGDIVLSLRPKLKPRGHTVTVSCPDDLAIRSYPGAFSQIIINLILNSVMHGFEEMKKGVITIDISPENGSLRLRYQDNGSGIAPEHLPVMFDPFFTTKRDKGGTGLGMHIVNITVKNMLKGSISCESTQGEGVIFLIEFPIETAQLSLHPNG
jgi:signal transduction histidine kinase